MVVSLHDLYPYDEPNNFGFPKVFFNRAFLQQCLKEVDCVACVSETTLSRLKTRFPRFAHRKSVVVRNCVTIDSNEPTLPLGQQGKFVLLVAQHRANKNIPLAINVFEQILERKMIDQESITAAGRQSRPGDRRDQILHKDSDRLQAKCQVDGWS